MMNKLMEKLYEPMQDVQNWYGMTYITIAFLLSTVYIPNHYSLVSNIISSSSLLHLTRKLVIENINNDDDDFMVLMVHHLKLILILRLSISQTHTCTNYKQPCSSKAKCINVFTIFIVSGNDIFNPLLVHSFSILFFH